MIFSHRFKHILYALASPFGVGELTRIKEDLTWLANTMGKSKQEVALGRHLEPALYDNFEEVRFIPGDASPVILQLRVEDLEKELKAQKETFEKELKAQQETINRLMAVVEKAKK